MANRDSAYLYIWRSHYDDGQPAHAEPETVWDADRHGMTWRLKVNSEQYPGRRSVPMGTLVLKGSEDGVLRCLIQ